MDEWVEFVESLFGDSGWSLYEPDMGMESLLEAPDGCVIEQDGKCSHGYVSPLRLEGLI
jgi:hypothetical protein